MSFGSLGYIVLASSASSGTINPGLSGLVGYWPLSMQQINFTTEIANDVSGSGNNGTMSGLTVSSETTGLVNTALIFDGASSAISISDVSSYSFPNSSFTVTALFKTSQTSSGVIVGKDGFGTGWFVSILASGQVLAETRGTGSATPALRASSGSTYNDGNWHLVCASISTNTTTSSGNSITIYMDGVLEQGTLTSSSVVYLSTSIATSIGRRNISSPLYYSGALQEVRIYNTSFTPSNVSTLFAAY